MPSETKLLEDYDVSRVTLRQALAELEKDGIIKRYHGKGAYIMGTTPKPYVHDLNYRLVSGEWNEESKRSITADILMLKLIDNPYPEVTASLRLEKSAKAIYLKRLFKLNKKSIAIGRSWLSAEMFPLFIERGMINASLSQTLRINYEIEAVRVDDCIEVMRSTPGEALILNSTADAPLLVVKGVSYSEDDTPIEYSQTSWRGDSVRFNISMDLTKQN